ncbi:MFS transporter [Sorangium sp. So ce1128]
MMTSLEKSKRVHWAVVVAALGYFVDVYDLLLFNILRVESLRAIGIPEEALREQGLLLVNLQMIGMLCGGVFWGVLGDKRGRISVLFGSILLYSFANIANGFADTLTFYGAMRFVAGVGLAGELGAGITLVSELMTKESRGYGTTVVAAVGLFGAVAAALVGDYFPWRTSYFIGGGLGLLLLALRFGVYESAVFAEVKKRPVVRGNFFQLLSCRALRGRYLRLIMFGVPVWYTTGILASFSPEIGKAMGMRETPRAGRAIMFCYIGLAVGDLASGLLSQILRSRRNVLLGFLALTAVSMAGYFMAAGSSIEVFYASCAIVGCAVGYWAVYMIFIAELFGTNLRATATTSVPNFVRAAVVPVTLAFWVLDARIGVVASTGVVAAIIWLLALLALLKLPETFGKSLDFVDK